jgi:DNA-binding cell septation regulator SpoVG
MLRDIAGRPPPQNEAARRSRSGEAKPKLKAWKPHRSGALLGFCSVQLPSGMILHDLRVMSGKNGLWVAMPAQKQLDRDGQPRLDANGKPIYSQIVEFVDRATAERFGAMVIDLVQRAHPGALDGAGA